MNLCASAVNLRVPKLCLVMNHGTLKYPVEHYEPCFDCPKLVPIPKRPLLSAFQRTFRINW